jgi:multidrug resistance efflux pump
LKHLLGAAGRVLFTGLVTLVAAAVGWQLWIYYMDAPWTRDGTVRADVVGVAPDVSGLVTQVLVADNQTVHRDDVLFRIDPARFQLALQQADATMAGRKATLDEAVREMKRYQALNNLSVSQEKQEQTVATVQEAAAAYQQALADHDTAQLNLQRSEVRASVNGSVTNFTLRPGDYVSAGHGVFALVDSDSLHVDGYFEETKLSRIRVGDPVAVRMMGDRVTLHGKVQSIASGVADRERSASGDLLANVNPTFSWVRLAQRVPVRVQLDTVPEDVRLLAGRTATVIVQNDSTPTVFSALARR